MSQKIKITLVKSSIGSVQKIIGTLKGLGLKKMQSTYNFLDRTDWTFN